MSQKTPHEAWSELDAFHQARLVDRLEEVGRLTTEAHLQLDNDRPTRAVRDLSSALEEALEVLSALGQPRVLVRPLQSPEDLQAALLRVQEIWKAEQGSLAGLELDVLTTLIERAEAPWADRELPGRSTFCQDRPLGELSGCPDCSGHGGYCGRRLPSTPRCAVLVAFERGADLKES